MKIRHWWDLLSKTGRRWTIVIVALVALITVSIIYNLSTGRGWLGYGQNPLAKCESQIKADAAYASCDGSLPAFCTGKTNGFTR